MSLVSEQPSPAAQPSSPSRALRETEYKFAQFAGCLPGLVWTCHGEGWCDYVSPRWPAFTGAPEASHFQLGWRSFIHPEDLVSMSALWHLSVQNGEAFQLEYRLRRFDETYHWFDTHVFPIRGLDGSILTWAGFSVPRAGGADAQGVRAPGEVFANLVSLVPGAFCSFVRYADGRLAYSYISPSFYELFGLAQIEVDEIANHMTQVVHPDDVRYYADCLEASAAGLSAMHVEYRISHPKRGTRWIEANASPEPLVDGATVWYGILRDVTARREAELDAEFFLKLGKAQQSAKDHDSLAEATTRLTAEYLGISRCRLTGTEAIRSRANAVEKQLANGVPLIASDCASHPATAPFYPTCYQPQGMRALVTIPLRSHNDWLACFIASHETARIWSDREVNLIRMVAERFWPGYEFLRAIAAERELVESLRKSEQRLRLALLSGSIGIWEQDPATGLVTWDQSTQKIFGITEAQPNLNDVFAAVHPDDLEMVKQNAKNYLDPDGPGLFDMEFRIYRRDTRTLRHVYSRGQTFFGGDADQRRAIRAIGTMEDVTALKQNEQALLDANKELEEFAYAASHDLKGPLRVIDNASRWLEEDLAGKVGVDITEHVTLLRSRVKRMERLLDDLLDYGRIGRSRNDESFSELAPGNVLVDDVLALVPAGNFRIDVSPVFAHIQVHRMPLQQILLNLVNNAVKHHSRRDGWIRIDVEDAGDRYRFSVQDDGPGIPARFHSQIFNMFQTLKPRDQVEGSGMGLALVRKHVEIFGGSVSVESAEGTGSTFRFTLPKQHSRWGDFSESVVESTPSARSSSSGRG